MKWFRKLGWNRWPDWTVGQRKTYLEGSLFPCIVVQLLSCVELFVTTWTAACQASLSLTISQSLPKFMSIASVILFIHLTPITLFSFCLQSFPASGSFPMSRLFTSGDKIIGASASASALQVSILGWFSLGLTGLISLLFKGFSRVFSSTPVWKHQFFSALLSLCPTLTTVWLLEKPHLWLYRPLSEKWCLYCLSLS